MGRFPSSTIFNGRPSRSDSSFTSLPDAAGQVAEPRHRHAVCRHPRAAPRRRVEAPGRRRRPDDPLPLRVGRHHRALAAFVVPAHRRSPKAVQSDNTGGLVIGRRMLGRSIRILITANLLCRSCVGSPSASPGPVRHPRYAYRPSFRTNRPNRAYPAHRTSTLLPVQPIVP